MTAVGRMEFFKTEELNSYKQPAFGQGVVDSLQYHFFAEDKVFAFRIFETPSLSHASFWAYDNGVHTIVDTDEPLERLSSSKIAVRNSRMTLTVDYGDGTFEVSGTWEGDAVTVEFKRRHTFYWEGPGTGPGYHQPDLEGKVTFRGKTYAAVGYSKRYWYIRDLDYWGYRFIQGPTDDRSMVLWTADATFAHHKYAYFKLLMPDGQAHSAQLLDSVHREDAARGIVDGTTYDVKLEELGSWSTVHKSASMDSNLRQRFCRMTIEAGDRSWSGYCLNETCFGTIR